MMRGGEVENDPGWAEDEIVIEPGWADEGIRADTGIRK